MGDRRENFRDNRQGRVDWRHNRGDQIRNHVRGRHTNFFTPGWRARHPHLAHGRWHWWGAHRPGHYWWRRATWASLTGWFVWQGLNPIQYDYGGNVYYYQDTVYVDGQEACSGAEYAQQAAVIAESVPEDVDEENVEWMPLGVFAVSNEEQSDPIMFLQLVVSKEGIIAGTYYNSVTEDSQVVEGMVDHTTQRAAWTVGDNKSTVMETGIYNLTEDETSVLVHFGGEQSQQWLMVRLEDPEEGPQTGE
ncbi:MAG: hypothetical protein ACC628_09700 [Pirellulaceae bacterium]